MQLSIRIMASSVLLFPSSSCVRPPMKVMPVADQWNAFGTLRMSRGVLLLFIRIAAPPSARSDGAQPDGLAKEWVKFSVSVIM